MTAVDTRTPAHRQLGKYMVYYYEAGDVIFRSGAPARRIFRIRSGKAKVLDTRDEEAPRVLALLGPGDYIGVEAFLGVPCYRVTVVALEDLSAYCLTPRQVEALAQKRPALYRELEEVYYTQKKRLQEPTRHASTHGRLAHTLLELYQRFGTDEEGYLDLEINQTDLAELAHISRQTLYRIAHQWKKQGVAQIAGHRVRLLNPARLEHLAGAEAVA